MDKFDSALKQELLKHGIDIRSSSTSVTIIRTLLRDLAHLKEQAADVSELIRQNAELAQNAMHYKIQLKEKEDELDGLRKAAGDDKKAYEDHVAFLERTIPQIGSLPKSKVLQEVWGTDIAKEPLNLLHYADRHLHELQESNMKLGQELDKQFVQTAGLLSKIKIRDNELQRLTGLISSGKWRSASTRPELTASQSYQLKVLQEKNADLERTIERLRTGQKVPMTMSDQELRKQLELAETARKELAEQVDRLNSKNTSLQGLIARYEFELRIVRIERDDFLRQLQEQQKESLALSRMVEEGEGHRLQPPPQGSAQSSGFDPKRNGAPLDENGNDASYGTKERAHHVPTGTRQTSARYAGDVENLTDDREEEGPDTSAAGTSMLLDKVAQYEAKFSKLSESLRTFRDAFMKKDNEIASLRSQIALVASAHEENALLHEELAKMREKSRSFKSEIHRLRRQISEYTAEAAKATELAASTTTTDKDSASGSGARGQAESGGPAPSRPSQQPVATQTASVDVAPINGRSTGANPGPSIALQTSDQPGGSTQQRQQGEFAPARTGAGTTAALKEHDARLSEEFALLKQTVAELNAKISLETERRKQAELRLLEERRQQMHNERQQQQQRVAEQPSKKFKASIHIHQINGEIELDPDRI